MIKARKKQNALCCMCSEQSAPENVGSVREFSASSRASRAELPGAVVGMGWDGHALLL